MGLDIRLGWILRVTSKILVTRVSPPLSTVLDILVRIDTHRPSTRSLPENIETVTVSSRTPTGSSLLSSIKCPFALNKHPDQYTPKLATHSQVKYRTNKTLSVSVNATRTSSSRLEPPILLVLPSRTPSGRLADESKLFVPYHRTKSVCKRMRFLRGKSGHRMETSHHPRRSLVQLQIQLSRIKVLLLLTRRASPKLSTVSWSTINGILSTSIFATGSMKSLSHPASEDTSVSRQQQLRKEPWVTEFTCRTASSSCHAPLRWVGLTLPSWPNASLLVFRPRNNRTPPRHLARRWQYSFCKSSVFTESTINFAEFACSLLRVR